MITTVNTKHCLQELTLCYPSLPACPLRFKSSKETSSAATPPRCACIIKIAVSDFTGQAEYSMWMDGVSVLLYHSP